MPHTRAIGPCQRGIDFPHNVTVEAPALVENDCEFRLPLSECYCRLSLIAGASSHGVGRKCAVVSRAPNSEANLPPCYLCFADPCPGMVQKPPAWMDVAPRQSVTFPSMKKKEYVEDSKQATTNSADPGDTDTGRAGDASFCVRRPTVRPARRGRRIRPRYRDQFWH